MMLSSEVVADLRAQVRWGGGREVAGFLAGAGRRIHRAYRVPSAAVVPRAFRMYPSDVDRIARAAKRANRELLAVYHSHPSGLAELSRADRTELTKSRWAWVILTLSTGNELRAAGFLPPHGRAFAVHLATD